MKKAFFLFVLALFQAYFLLLCAQERCEDFGRAGIATAELSHKTEFRAAALQPDGKIVLTGSYHDEQGGDVLVVRIHADGSPDESFGDRGKVVPAFSSDFDQGYSIAVTANGSIIVGGQGPSGAILIGLTAAGNPIASFGTGGNKGLGGVGPVWDLVAVGNAVYAIHGTGTGFQLTGIQTNGQPVANFGTSGIVPVPATGNVFGLRPMQLERLPDGSFLSAVTAESDGSPAILDNLLLHRFLTDGTPDTGWGTNGMLLEPESNGYHCRDLLIDGMGKVLVGGFKIDDNPDLTSVIAHRFLPNGNADPSFNGGGSSTHSTGHRLHAMTLAPTGEIYFAGKKELNNEVFFHLAAYTENGNVDTDLGLIDWLIPEAEVSTGELQDLIRFTDGSFLAVGMVSLTENSSRGIAVRLNMDGTVRTGWNESGYFWGHVVEQAAAVTARVDTDGSIVTVGVLGYTGSNGGHAGPVIARFLPDGRSDKRFGYRGRVSRDAGPGFRYFHSLEILSNGQLLAVGSFFSDGWGLARFHADGRPDSTFGINGWTNKRIGCSNCNRISGKAALDANGNILLAGSVGFVNNSNFEDAVIVRLLPDGEADTSFGNAGIARMEVTIFDHGYTDVAAFSDNSVLAGGFAYFSDSAGLRQAGLLTKFTPAGIPDSTFGTDGSWFWNPGNDFAEFGQVEILPTGKLLLAGRYRGANGPDDLRVMVMRLLPDGTPDVAFGNNGIVEVSYGNADDYRFDGLSIDSQGNLFLSGYLFASGFRTFIAKFDSTGGADLSFGTQGVHILLNPLTNLNGPPTLLSEKGILLPGTVGNSEAYTLICVELRSTPTPIEVPFSAPKPFLVYPNPATNYLRIEKGTPSAGASWQVEVLDMQGRRCVWSPLQADSLLELQNLKLPAGMYVVRIFVAGQLVQVEKLLIR